MLTPRNFVSVLFRPRWLGEPERHIMHPMGARERPSRTLAATTIDLQYETSFEGPGASRRVARRKPTQCVVGRGTMSLCSSITTSDRITRRTLSAPSCANCIDRGERLRGRGVFTQHRRLHRTRRGSPKRTKSTRSVAGTLRRHGPAVSSPGRLQFLGRLRRYRSRTHQKLISALSVTSGRKLTI